jgi:hypothetical protein
MDEHERKHIRRQTQAAMRCPCGAEYLIGEAGLVCSACARRIVPGIRVDKEEIRKRISALYLELETLRAVEESIDKRPAVFGVNLLREVWPERVIECQDMSKVEL